MRSHTTRGTSRPLVAFVTALAVLAAVSVVPGPAPAEGAPAPAKFLGPLISRAETPNLSLGRDGGFSVALPNGFDFWVFADSPRWEWKNGKWRLTGFITGATAAMTRFTPGKPLKNLLSEIRPGRALRSTNPPSQFLKDPVAYVPDGSGRRCTKFNAGQQANSVRWPSGAALMPDKTNILVPYFVVCVINANKFTAQGWGFALFNYKTQKFTVPPTDVIRAQPSGASLPSRQGYGSPIIVNKKVTFYSWSCCFEDPAIYTTTVNATAAALKNPASYAPTPIPGLRATYNLHVAPKSKYHKKFTMYQLRGDQGQYTIHSASNPLGPWSEVASGVLPRCDTSPAPCHSMALHPELSPAGRLNLSYHLPGFGPGIATKHPYPREPLRHVVSASIPCSC
jgi:hypothetical protein